MTRTTVITLLIAASSIAATASTAAAQSSRAELAADRVEIAELGARFDNSLDAEDASAFVGTFVPDGVLAGFWGEAKGPKAIEGAFDYMLATFARNKRHVVTNHWIEVSGDRATMYSYLTVFDRKALAVTGTATFTDELARTSAGWRFTRRTLKADPNVDGIIAKLKPAR